MSDHHDSNDQEAAYHRFNKEAKAALENNAGRVMVKAATAGDIYTVNMIMDHDSTLHGTKKSLPGIFETRIIFIPNTFPRRLQKRLQMTTITSQSL